MAARKQHTHMYQPHHSPENTPLRQPESPKIVRRRTSEKPKRKFVTFKTFIISSCIGLFTLMLVQLYMTSQINHVHYEIQSTRSMIEQQISINEQLSAEVSNLSQHARIIEIATSNGLTFNEENIINIRSNR